MRARAFVFLFALSLTCLPVPQQARGQESTIAPPAGTPAPLLAPELEIRIGELQASLAVANKARDLRAQVSALDAIGAIYFSHG